MMICDGPAQMIIPGPETGRPPREWLVHNDDPANEVYVDVTPAIMAMAGAQHIIIPPGTSIALTGHQTFWAAVRPGTTANLHVIPSGTYGATGQPASG